MSQKRWYAVFTRTHAENRAEYHLNVQGFKTFVARQHKTIRHARQHKSVLRPYFPRYIFVSLDLTRDRWLSVNGTYGVSSLVMNGERPAPVPDGVVETFIEATDEAGVLIFDRGLSIGNSVRLLSGPLAGQIGKLLSIDASGRVRVLLNLLGGSVPVCAASQILAPAD